MSVESALPRILQEAKACRLETADLTAIFMGANIYQAHTQQRDVHRDFGKSQDRNLENLQDKNLYRTGRTISS